MAGVGGLIQVNLAQGRSRRSDRVPRTRCARRRRARRREARGWPSLGVRLLSRRAAGCGRANGLNLLGVSPYAFKMVIGLTILAAISLSNVDLVALLTDGSRRRDHVGSSLIVWAACLAGFPGLLGLLVLTMVAFGSPRPQFLSRRENFNRFPFRSPIFRWFAPAGDARTDHPPADEPRSLPLRTSAVALLGAGIRNMNGRPATGSSHSWWRPAGAGGAWCGHGGNDAYSAPIRSSLPLAMMIFLRGFGEFPRMAGIFPAFRLSWANSPGVIPAFLCRCSYSLRRQSLARAARGPVTAFRWR